MRRAHAAGSAADEAAALLLPGDLGVAQGLDRRLGCDAPPRVEVGGALELRDVQAPLVDPVDDLFALVAALRAALTGVSDPLPWVPALGARPPEPEIAAAWLDAATAITAYRERYELAEHMVMLGARPAASRPEARATFDHARALADHYLARRLDQLDTAQLERLDADQRAILDNPPNFNPFTLEPARRSLDAATRAWSVTTAPWCGSA